MFEPLNTKQNLHLRIRKLAIIMGIVSLLIIVTPNYWSEIEAREDADYGFSYYPNTNEIGVALGLMLALVISVGLLLVSFMMKWLARK